MDIQFNHLTDQTVTTETFERPHYKPTELSIQLGIYIVCFCCN